ncbi:Hemolymph lipopolysaccharide-binding protein [Blattella germanica]|nr:Hemolymph lipopolysaccharide-binding protein [Blattella germanica]
MLAFAIVYSVFWGGVMMQQQCTSQQTSATKFSVASRRNQTGHWNAKLHLQHETPYEVSDLLEVEVDHRTTKCENFESVLLDVALAAPPSAEKNPLGYELVKGFGYYKLYTIGRTWEEAFKICARDGAHLLVINSAQEANGMKPLLEKNETLESSGYAEWHSGEPNSGVGLNCGELYVDLTLGITSCTYTYPFICEM